MKKLLCLIISLMLLVSLAACSDGDSQSDPSADSPASGAESTVSASSENESSGETSVSPPQTIPGLEQGDTVMTLDGNSLTLAEFNYIAAGTKENMLYYYRYMLYSYTGREYTDAELMDYELSGSRISELILLDSIDAAKNLLAVENLAKQLGLTISDDAKADIDSYVSDIKTSFGSDAAYKSELAKLGTTENGIIRYESYFELVKVISDYRYGDNGVAQIGDSVIVSLLNDTYVRISGGMFTSATAEKTVRAEAEGLLASLKDGSASGFPTENSGAYSYIASEAIASSGLPQAVFEGAKKASVGDYFLVELEGTGWFVLQKEALTDSDLKAAYSDLLSAAQDDDMNAYVASSAVKTELKADLAGQYDISAVPALSDNFYN